MTRLREFREKAGISQVELSKLTGVSERSVIRWEQGESINMDNLLKLAAALNVTPNELLGVGTGGEKDGIRG